MRFLKQNGYKSEVLVLFDNTITNIMIALQIAYVDENILE